MIKKTILTSLTLLWMITIFVFSNQKATTSTEKSHSFIRNTIVNIYKIFDRDASSEKIELIVDKYDFPVRKIAHFTEYFILGLLVCLTLKAYKIDNIYIMILICFIYACSDEFHQLFVLGRSAQIIDVILDSFGSVLAIIILNRRK